MTFLAGQILTASALNELLLDTYVQKAASQSVTSSSAVVDDNDIQFTLAAGTYLIDMFAHASGLEAADLKIVWSNTGTMTISRTCTGAAVGMTDRLDSTVVVRGMAATDECSYGVDTTGTTIVHESLAVVVTVAGTLKMRWAQNTSNATATALSTATRAICHKVA